MQETWVRFQGQEDPLEKEMATHSSILAWKVLWTENPSGLESTGLERAGHDLVTKQQQIAFNKDSLDFRKISRALEIQGHLLFSVKIFV